MSDRARICVALVVASLVHVAAQSGLRSSQAPMRTVGAPAAEPPMVEALDIDLEATSEPARPSIDGKPAATTVRIASIRGSGGARGSSAHEIAGQGSAQGEQASQPETSPSTAGSSWSFRPTIPNIIPRASELALANGGRAEAAAPPPASTTGGLLESLDSADVARGLGRGGAVRSAIDLAAHATDAPVRGSATFSITIFSDGKVDVQLASNQTDWALIIPAIRERLRELQVRLPPNSQGLNVVVAVDAKVKYPDGYEPPPDGTSVTADTALAVDKPWLDVRVRGRRCSGGVAIAAGGAAAGGGCAVGTAARIVSTRIVSERRL